MNLNKNQKEYFEFLQKYKNQKLELLESVRKSKTNWMVDNEILNLEETLLKIYAKLLVDYTLHFEKRSEYKKYNNIDTDMESVLFVINGGNEINQVNILIYNILIKIICNKGISNLAELIDISEKKYFKWMNNLTNVKLVERFLTGIKMLKYYYGKI